MATFNKRIFDTTNLIEKQLAEKATQPGADIPPTPGPARTAPGQLMRTSSQIVELQDELAAMREKLKKWDNSMPTSYMDPKTITRSSWANRHEKSFVTADFQRFKENIAAAGGNVQPILVRKTEEGGHELVFGHRRHQACLELGLPVLTLVWDRPMGAREHFLAMERENREKANLSAYETGMMYAAALDAGFYPSERQLAEAIGVSRSWIQKAMRVARLPPAIVEAFGSPLEIKPAHAEAIQEALEENSKVVLKRAEKLRQEGTKLRVNGVVAALLGHETEASGPKQMRTSAGAIGKWHRDSRGRTVFVLNGGLADDEQAEAIIAAIGKVLGSK